MNRVFAIVVILIAIAAGCAPPQPACRPCTGKSPYGRAPFIGMPLPDVTLDGQQAGVIKKFRTGDVRGKWLVLFFYPGDFTFVCPTELRELADYYGEFRNVGAEVMSVSTDSAFVHRAWREHNESVKKVNFPMLADRNGALARLFGVYDDEKGQAQRASFIISPGGKVAAFEVHHESVGRSADELLRKLQAAAAATGSHGGMCPAGWKPGGTLIKPE